MKNAKRILRLLLGIIVFYGLFYLLIICIPALVKTVIDSIKIEADKDIIEAIVLGLV